MKAVLINHIFARISWSTATASIQCILPNLHLLEMKSGGDHTHRVNGGRLLVRETWLHCRLVNVYKIFFAVPPGIANVSNDQVECEGSMVTLVCNATGRPTPNVTWTKVDDNGMDSAPLLPVVQGKYILSNILRYTDATYRCTADNGVGTPDNRTVSVKVKCKSRYLYSYDLQTWMTMCRKYILCMIYHAQMNKLYTLIFSQQIIFPFRNTA